MKPYPPPLAPALSHSLKLVLDSEIAYTASATLFAQDGEPEEEEEEP